MLVSDLVLAMEDIAPTKYAEEWDNVGLLVGDPQVAVSTVMLTIDFTAAVAEEARSAGCQAVVAYHPPIFSALKNLRAGQLVFDAIRAGIAIYSPHTALDVASGGTNDVLADAMGLANLQPLKLASIKATQLKLVVFVPKNELAHVSAALFAAGAGRIGRYSSCSFQCAGTGTFFGEEGTNPTIGQAGHLETAEEIRLEAVVAFEKVEAVIQALRKTHPYEEPAFDLNVLSAPAEGIGIGRIGNLPQPAMIESLITQLKAALELNHLLVAGPIDRPVQRVAVCAGSCGEMLNEAIRQKADLLVTGEMRHHSALQAAAAGLTVICTLHSNSERAALRRLRDRLSKHLPAAQFLLSRQDRDPFAVH